MDITKALQDVLEKFVADHPELALTLSILGAALSARFERTGRASDLDDAITAGQQAVDALPTGHTDRAACLNNLAIALRDRFELTGQASDLDEAITAATKEDETVYDRIAAEVRDLLASYPAPGWTP